MSTTMELNDAFDLTKCMWAVSHQQYFPLASAHQFISGARECLDRSELTLDAMLDLCGSQSCKEHNILHMGDLYHALKIISQAQCLERCTPDDFTQHPHMIQFIHLGLLCPSTDQFETYMKIGPFASQENKLMNKIEARKIWTNLLDDMGEKDMFESVFSSIWNLVDCNATRNTGLQGFIIGTYFLELSLCGLGLLNIMPEMAWKFIEM
ncbi:hypothetical protein K439DRAFT_1618157 [Ramaria rubella]|nr:hypothetical protein K439DRAFT_1618157 [Ramaria rubella]